MCYCTFQGTDGRRGPPGQAVSKFKHMFCFVFFAFIFYYGEKLLHIYNDIFPSFRVLLESLGQMVLQESRELEGQE